MGSPRLRFMLSLSPFFLILMITPRESLASVEKRREKRQLFSRRGNAWSPRQGAEPGPSAAEAPG